MSWSNETVLKFLDYYENEPTIWNTSLAINKNRYEVHAAWKRLELKMDNKYTVPYLKKKRDALMASYRICLAKVKQSVECAENPEDIFKPPWYAYEKLASFLQEIGNPEEIPIEEEANKNNKKRRREEEELEEDDAVSLNSGIEVLEQDDIQNDSLVLPAGSNSVFKAPLLKERKITEIEEIKNKMNNAHSMLQAAFNKPVKERNIYSLYGELLAEKLRSLDEHSRDICMNRIDNLMFEMKYNTTVKSNDNRQSHSTQLLDILYSPNHLRNPPSPTPQSSIVIDHTFSIPLQSLSPSQIKREKDF